MKSLKLFCLLFVFLLAFQGIAFAENETLDLEVQLFYTANCPHCANAKVFLDSIHEEYHEVSFNYYSIDSKEGLTLLIELYGTYEVPFYEKGAVPIIFIGQDYFVGFTSRTRQQIETSIQKQLLADSITEETEPEQKLPFFNGINLENYSLPVVAIILGFIDGFNVCSLGAIILILSLVLALKSRKLILIVGGTFILVTAVVYGLLVFFWHQIFSLLTPWARLMQIIIGIMVFCGGLYFVREFLRLRKYGPVCSVSNTGIHAKATKWIEKFFKNPKNPVLLIGAVLLFAAVVVLIEFPCSAVVPLIFAGMLAEAQLSGVLTFAYISLFMLFYLLDELVIFLAAVFTMKIALASPRFLTWLHLIAAFFLFGLGLYYVVGLI